MGEGGRRAPVGKFDVFQARMPELSKEMCWFLSLTYEFDRPLVRFSSN